MIVIREGARGDAAAFSAIATSTFVETFGRLYRREDLDAFLEKSHAPAAYEALLADPHCALWLALTQEGEAAAYCVAGPCTLPAPDMPERSGELARLYVASAWQEMRLGERLLETALRWLESRFDRIYLSVYAENFRAQRLYAKHGFVKIHDYFYMVGEQADPEWIMELRRS